MDRLQNQSLLNLRETCAEHRQELQYYCVECDASICADCAMFSDVVSEILFESLGQAHPFSSFLYVAQRSRISKTE